ncbi:MAG: DUF4197 domain-containing protein [Gammaproteobacteria bacterium]|nr:DUF4197 domain-containing protein [Gammaproteobacteria bacterium]
MIKLILLTFFIFFSQITFAFNFGNLAEDLMKNKTVADAVGSSNDKSAGISKLDSDLITKGLKQALKQGVETAVNSLGKENGFLSNKLVKIPLPGSLAKSEKIIRKMGGDKLADDLILSMNKAATTAAPETIEILVSAVTSMQIDDAKKILAGDNQAATNYFRNKTGKQLTELITPIIQKTMKQNKVAYYYDQANQFYKTTGKSYVEKSGVMNYAKQFGVDSYLPGEEDENIDGYVTNKAIDGLFIMIASKEKEIRENPVARSTSILKQVFGQ